MGLPRLVGINHIAVEVDDVDAAIEFFGGVFDVSLRGRAGGMAFIDLGDQFIALAPRRSQPADTQRHVGLVVDDREATLVALRAAGVEIIGRNDFLDPSGNRWQVVDYRDVQFTKTPEILRGMGLDGLEKSESAIEELRAKGLA